MEFWLQKDNDDKIQLPVKPSEFTVAVAHRNTVVNVVQLGDINLIGKTGLREISLSSFFPAKDYNFSNNFERKKPKSYIKTLEKWRKSGEPIRVIITGILNMKCTIESFSYGEKDATRDVYYTIYLKEHKKIKQKKIKKASIGKSSTRTTKKATANSGKTYVVKKGDTLWKIAKKFYGDGSKYTKIYNANKKILKSAKNLSIGQVLTIP